MTHPSRPFSSVLTSPRSLVALQTPELLLPAPEPREAVATPQRGEEAPSMAPVLRCSPEGRLALAERFGFLDSAEARDEDHEEAWRVLVALGHQEGQGLALDLRRRIGEALGVEEPALPGWAVVGGYCRAEWMPPGAPPRMVVAVEDREVVLNGGERVPAGYLRRGWREVGPDEPVTLAVEMANALREPWNTHVGAARRAVELSASQPDPASRQVWLPPAGRFPSWWRATDGTLLVVSVEGKYAYFPERYDDGTRTGWLIESMTDPANGWRCIGVETAHGRVMVGDGFRMVDGDQAERTILAVVSGTRVRVGYAGEDGTCDVEADVFTGPWSGLDRGYHRTRYAPARLGERYRCRKTGEVDTIHREIVDGARIDPAQWERVDPGAPRTVLPRGSALSSFAGIPIEGAQVTGEGPWQVSGVVRPGDDVQLWQAGRPGATGPLVLHGAPPVEAWVGSLGIVWGEDYARVRLELLPVVPPLPDPTGVPLAPCDSAPSLEDALLAGRGLALGCPRRVTADGHPEDPDRYAERLDAEEGRRVLEQAAREAPRRLQALTVARERGEVGTREARALVAALDAVDEVLARRRSQEAVAAGLEVYRRRAGATGWGWLPAVVEGYAAGRGR